MSQVLRMLKIGNVKIKNRLFLAPMLDVTDLAYRILCRKCGAGMAYSEMINVPAILHENEKTKCMMKSCRADRPLGVQITGNNLVDFEKVASYLKSYDLIDINCGCPADRITENDSGSYLLTNPEKVAKMIKILKKEDMTVSAKIRLGFKKNNVLEVAKRIEKAGVDAITVHARLANQGYDVPADWSWIEKVKKEVGIPVIGNGDINSGESAKKMLEICDGAMIGRAAIGEPLIFERILHYFKTGKEKELDFGKNIKLFGEYIKLSEKYEVVDISKIKYLGCKFIKGTKGAAEMRQKLMQIKTFKEIKEFF